MTTYELFVPGVVRGQGSMTLWRASDGTERAKHPPATVEWRNLLCDRLSRWWEGRPPLREAVSVSVVATFGRPKGHLGTGRNGGRLRASAPVWHTVYPDGDKVLRLVDDALVIAGVIADDAQVAVGKVFKQWSAPDERPGALIVVEAL